MKKHTLFSIFILTTILASCSTQAWYSAAQQRNQQTCLDDPSNKLEKCQEQQMSYDQYQREREKVK
ncbi:hypothetical protein BegalDRAFT_1249 [Beggiatoa alba B18LD]|uniref:Lipoprotein n=1 Tax=Beggiatoa alba B18LD TaxID=395493 RepID=I3CEV5_9GAMM|nr:hypothetical protein [Beggiatoa alba]EIJ42148.1 hypothetical protein BegalDRAFT_1249 [Beggiatoa alba B18LD]